jgi:hypothetical protein
MVEKFRCDQQIVHPDLAEVRQEMADPSKVQNPEIKGQEPLTKNPLRRNPGNDIKSED